MEIQKIYSDLYDEERLYSVLMDEDEIRMFTGAVKKANKILKNKLAIEKAAEHWDPRIPTKLTPEEMLNRGRRLIRGRRYEKTTPEVWSSLGSRARYKELPLNDRINLKSDRLESIYPRGHRKYKRHADAFETPLSELDKFKVSHPKPLPTYPREENTIRDLYYRPLKKY